MISNFSSHPYLSPYEKPVEEFLQTLFVIYKKRLQLKEGYSEEFIIPGDRYGLISFGSFGIDSAKSPVWARGTKTFCFFEIYLAMVLGEADYQKAQAIGTRSAIALSSVIPSLKLEPDLNGHGIFYDLVPDSRIDFTLSQDTKPPHYFRMQVGTTIFAKLAIKSNTQGIHEL